jgi:hypothetical protein
MNTKTKLNIASYTTSTMILLNVFSKPLHIPELLQWVLNIGVFIPLVLIFRFAKELRRKKAGALDAADATTASLTESRKKARRRLLLMMALGCCIGLCSPLWLPFTGTTLGTGGDFLVGIVTVVIVCTIFGFRLRKI